MITQDFRFCLQFSMVTTINLKLYISIMILEDKFWLKHNIWFFLNKKPYCKGRKKILQ